MFSIKRNDHITYRIAGMFGGGGKFGEFGA